MMYLQMHVLWNYQIKYIYMSIILYTFFCEENIWNLFFWLTKYSTLSQTTMTILFSDSPITVELCGPEFIYLHSPLHAKPMAVTIIWVHSALDFLSFLVSLMSPMFASLFCKWILSYIQSESNPSHLFC